MNSLLLFDIMLILVFIIVVMVCWYIYITTEEPMELPCYPETMKALEHSLKVWDECYHIVLDRYGLEDKRNELENLDA